MVRMYSAIAKSAKETPDGIEVVSAIRRVALLEPGRAQSLAPYKLWFGIAGEDLAAGEHVLRIILRTPAGEQAALKAQSVSRNGMITGSYTFGAAGPTQVGTYEFVYAVDDTNIGVEKLEVVRASGAACATFFVYRQDMQGITQGDKYIRGSLGFEVMNGDAYVGRFGVGIWQPQGLDSTEDELDLHLPSARFDSPSFRAAVRAAHDHYVLAMFGGKFPKGGEIKMANNIFADSFSVDFELADVEPRSPSGGGW